MPESRSFRGVRAGTQAKAGCCSVRKVVRRKQKDACLRPPGPVEYSGFEEHQLHVKGDTREQSGRREKQESVFGGVIQIISGVLWAEPQTTVRLLPSWTTSAADIPFPHQPVCFSGTSLHPGSAQAPTFEGVQGLWAQAFSVHCRPLPVRATPGDVHRRWVLRDSKHWGP